MLQVAGLGKILQSWQRVTRSVNGCFSCPGDILDIGWGQMRQSVLATLHCQKGSNPFHILSAKACSHMWYALIEEWSVSIYYLHRNYQYPFTNPPASLLYSATSHTTIPLSVWHFPSRLQSYMTPAPDTFSHDEQTSPRLSLWRQLPPCSQHQQDVHSRGTWLDEEGHTWA